jgi:hypothetical protein
MLPRRIYSPRGVVCVLVDMCRAMFRWWGFCRRRRVRVPTLPGTLYAGKGAGRQDAYLPSPEPREFDGASRLAGLIIVNCS